MYQHESLYIVGGAKQEYSWRTQLNIYNSTSLFSHSEIFIFHKWNIRYKDRGIKKQVNVTSKCHYHRPTRKKHRTQTPNMTARKQPKKSNQASPPQQDDCKTKKGTPRTLSQIKEQTQKPHTISEQQLTMNRPQQSHRPRIDSGRGQRGYSLPADSAVAKYKYDIARTYAMYHHRGNIK